VPHTNAKPHRQQLTWRSEERKACWRMKDKAAWLHRDGSKFTDCHRHGHKVMSARRAFGCEPGI
jgi:hypothetical protein